MSKIEIDGKEILQREVDRCLTIISDQQKIIEILITIPCPACFAAAAVFVKSRRD